MKITEISIKRTTIPVVLFTLLAIGGLFTYSLLNKELVPNMEVPVNAVMTVYPGASPSEVETSVSKKIEDAVSAIEGIKTINTYSLESMSIVVINYKDGIDADLSLQDCERKVNAIKTDLPENCKEPQFMKFDMNMFPVMTIAAKANIPDKDFYDIVDKEIRTGLSQIKGVASVTIIGGNQREIQIKVDAQKIEQLGLSLIQVKQMIEAANVDFPTGKIKDNETKFIVRISGKFNSLDEIRNLVIGASRDGSVIKVRDVASVVDGTRKATKLAHINGQPAIGLTIQKQTDGNAVEISKEVHKILAEYEKEYKKDHIEFNIASDTSIFTEQAVSGVMIDLVLAIILVSITMLLFLHTFRNLIFIFVSIPTSIISTFTFFWLFGFSLNLLTLLAMSIVVGVIVDDAIVILENIYRHMEMGKNRLQATLDATKEIGLTVTSITIVLCAVFLPIGLTTGMTGQMLRSFSLVVVISILISLLVSFTLVPLLTSRYGKLKVFKQSSLMDRFLLYFEHIITWVRLVIIKGTKICMSHKAATLIIATVCLFGSFLLLQGGFIQTEMMDAGDRGEFILTMELDRTATLEQTNALCFEIERNLLQYPEITNVFTKVGSKGGSLSVVETPYGAEFNITLVGRKDRSLSTKLFSKKLQNDMQTKYAGPVFMITEVSMLGTTQTPIEVYVQCNNFEKAKNFSALVLEEIRSIQGSTDIESTIENGDREMVIQFDREKLAKLGLTIGEIGNQMYMAFEGNRDLKYRDGSNEYDILISYDEFNRERKADIENISFVNRSGQLIRLSQVAKIIEGESPATLIRYNKLPAVKISGNMIGKTIGTIGKEIKAKVALLDKPVGVEVIYAGNMERQSESYLSMGIALLASIIFMYLIMVALYDSYAYPLVVMLSLPLCMIGALFALALSGKSLSIFAIMGIIMLMGLVAKNAILVVDFANDMQQKGKSAAISIIQATNTRFRPIVMTNLALIVGMLPIALASGAGAEWKNGLGWVLIGGLISSMILSFLIVPVLYVIIDKIIKKFRKDDKMSMESVS